jgi:hypothetical protein
MGFYLIGHLLSADITKQCLRHPAVSVTRKVGLERR